jgi:hypothetical protein
MSCEGGNRFVCGMKRFQKHSFEPEKPVNVTLHNENEKKLQDLLRIREEQDKGIFNSSIPVKNINPSNS